MLSPESLDQFKDQRDDLVALAVRRCEDVLQINPALVAYSEKIDPARIIDSHVEALKAEFYPEVLREYLIIRSKEIYELGALQNKWGEAAEARKAIADRLKDDERVIDARRQAMKAIRDGVDVQLRATFDLYSGYEPTIQEVSRDITELGERVDNLSVFDKPEKSGGGAEGVNRLTPRGIMASAGNLFRYFH